MEHAQTSPAATAVEHPAPLVAHAPHVHQKSVGVALALAFFFGAFGYFYVARWWIALILVVVEVVLLVLTLGLAALILWPVNCVVCAVQTSNQNKRAIERANRAYA